ncbi:MAG: TonB-dependent receptor [Flavobacteriales bacterium]|nr:TonB-dependent receptor [Flavobacteriales bacterium]MCB9193002.1 TonB-dependent receptor [Flavobacteriales bacterium]
MKPLPALAILLCVLTPAGPAWAQRPQGGAPPHIGKVYGKVLDASTGKSAAYATVAYLWGPKDSLVTGSIVRPNGDFDLDQLPLGWGTLRVSFIGYRTLDTPVTLDRQHLELDLGDLELHPDQELLKEVEVVGEKSQSVLRVDRRVYNVDRDLASKGGSAVDIMKNIPGLSVDVDGNVSLRNAQPKLLVDGRPTSLELDQIPSDEIDHVEVITNPSVAFDANSTGGIINVVLKKNDKPGYSGQVQLGAGTNDRYQAGANLQVKEGRFNFNLSYNFYSGANRTKGFNDRTDLYEGEVLDIFRQNNMDASKRTYQGGRFSVDYAVTNRSTLTLTGNVRGRNSTSDELQTYSTREPFGTLLSSGDQDVTERHGGYNIGGRLGFLHKSPKEGKQWSIDAGYGVSRRDNTDRYVRTDRDAEGSLVEGAPHIQDQLGNSNGEEFDLQADARDPLNAHNTIEYGVKSGYDRDHSRLDVFDRNAVDPAGVFDSTLSNNYRTTSLINAAYVNWIHKLSDHWSLQAGLRFESSWFKGELLDRGEEFSYSYPDGGKDLGRALFPGIYLSRKWDGDGGRELQFNLSRKISRPRFWQLTPFIHSSDPTSIRRGNPLLRPEMSNLAEVNHLLPFGNAGKSNWLTSIFVRQTQDVITSVAYPLEEDSTILVNTWANGDDNWDIGWENALRIIVGKNVDMTLSGTVQYTQVALTSNGSTSNNTGWSGGAKAAVNYKPVKVVTVQLSGDYDWPRIVPQGRTASNYGIDASANWDITPKLALTASVNDVLNSRHWGSTFTTERFIQETDRRRESRFARLTLTWRFGQRDVSLFRRNKTQREQQREPGLDQNDQEGF